MSVVHELTDYTFAGLSHGDVKELFHDGRFASHCLTKIVNKWYPKLVRTTENYISYRDDNNNPYLLRMFTNGMKFMPSKQLGVGRTRNPKETKEKGKELRVIVAITDDFPRIRLSFCKFSQLIEWYPDATVPEYDLRFIESLHVQNIVPN